MTADQLARERWAKAMGEALRAEEVAKQALHDAFRAQFDAYVAEREVHDLNGDRAASKKAQKALNVIIMRGRGVNAVVRDALYVSRFARWFA